MFRLFGVARDVSLLQSAQIATGAHPAVTVTGIGAFYWGANWSYREADNIPRSAEVAKERNCFFIVIYGQGSITIFVYLLFDAM